MNEKDAACTVATAFVREQQDLRGKGWSAQDSEGRPALPKHQGKFLFAPCMQTPPCSHLLLNAPNITTTDPTSRQLRCSVESVVGGWQKGQAPSAALVSMSFFWGLAHMFLPSSLEVEEPFSFLVSLCFVGLADLGNFVFHGFLLFRTI